MTFKSAQTKKHPILTVTLLALLSLIAIPALAAEKLHPLPNQISFLCPKTKFDPGNNGNVLVNDGTTISGTGDEYINGHTARPFRPFFSTPTPVGIPADLKDGNYVRASTSYLPATGTIMCHYVSTLGFPPFSVSYVMKNGLDGVVKTSAATFIVVEIVVHGKHA